MLFTKERKYLLASLLLFLYCFIMTGQNTEAKSVDNINGAKVVSYVNKIKEATESTTTDNLWWYSANVSPISEFFDYQGNYNTIYESETLINLVKYNKDFSVTESYSIKKPYPLYGGAITDIKGNYYIVYGQNDEAANGNRVVISLVKYNSKLEYIAELTYKGFETCPYPGNEWGTRYPFDAHN